MAKAPERAITLKGSCDTVVQFFGYAVNSILYQRGLYPASNFVEKKMFGVPLMVTTNEGLSGYIDSVLGHLKTWLTQHNAQKLLLVINRVDNGETLEIWHFPIDCDRTVTEDSAPRMKDEAAVTREIKFLIRQIVASNTFLPTLDCACTFELLVYADKRHGRASPMA